MTADQAYREDILSEFCPLTGEPHDDPPDPPAEGYCAYCGEWAGERAPDRLSFCCGGELSETPPVMTDQRCERDEGRAFLLLALQHAPSDGTVGHSLDGAIRCHLAHDHRGEIASLVSALSWLGWEEGYAAGFAHGRQVAAERRRGR